MSTQKSPRKNGEIIAYQLLKVLAGGSGGSGGGGNGGSSIMGELVRQRQAKTPVSNDSHAEKPSGKVVGDIKKSDDSET